MTELNFILLLVLLPDNPLRNGTSENSSVGVQNSDHKIILFYWKISNFSLDLTVGNKLRITSAITNKWRNKFCAHAVKQKKRKKKTQYGSAQLFRIILQTIWKQIITRRRIPSSFSLSFSSLVLSNYSSFNEQKCAVSVNKWVLRAMGCYSLAKQG